MRWHTSFFLLGFAALFCSTAASAADAPPCTEAVAKTVAVDDVLKNLDPYFGTCVRIHGLLANRALYPDLKTFYRREMGPRFSSLIAVYGNEDAEELWGPRSMVEFVGTVTSCSAIWAGSEAAADEANKSSTDGTTSIPFVTGICHYTDVPAIIVTKTTWLRDEPARLTGATQNTLHGNLDRVPPLSPRIAKQRSIAERWFDALRRKDAEALFPGDTSMRYVLEDEKSPARALMGIAKPLEISYFRNTDWDKIDPGWRDTYACVCTRDDCSGKWPISTLDAQNDEADWPYFCLRISAEGYVEI